MSLDFHEEVLKLANLPLSENMDDGSFTSDISLMCNDLNKNLNKLSKSQKELSFSVEEIYEYIQNLKEAEDKKSNEYDFVNKLVSIVDIIEDFYVFALEKEDQVVISHAEMLWNSIQKKISSIGLSRIYDEKTALDVVYNTVAGSDSDTTIPEGFILKTIKSGYTYNGKVIRKSNVIVNKYN